ncbi:poly(R)-hydroxyalkanoic acid synthase subunit [Natronomonas salina]|uniref:poly(R)-hydroxyalkanoic acid synthase subunit PhaE n=1 Tax=Natronomonas salina TaxID=1710540 RepID=UPI0015B65071|nr:poly(R)-hydroxyalkanoic acid synthase subunit PhaE [Natronomonas salina]QLD89771.1 poly(R)-hydroxyalkanoic acid synthase subunit [Natronomonas salina]
MSNANEEMMEQWNELAEDMNEAMAQSMEQNMEASAAFMESWADAMEQSIPDDEEFAESVEGYNDAYEVWMDAADQMFERSVAAAEGEDVAATEFRDIWLQSANEAFKEVMGTAAFAAANGQLVNAMMEMREQVDEMSEDTLQQLGMPTQSNVEEIGERLIELERRQHRVEEKLDQVLEALD